MTDSTPPASAETSAAPNTWLGASQHPAAANSFTSPAPSIRKRIERDPQREAEPAGRARASNPDPRDSTDTLIGDAEQREPDHQPVRNTSAANVRDAHGQQDAP